MTLLQRLEAVTQVRSCHLCYYPDTNCRCSGVLLSTPLTSWSQIKERTPVYRTTASSGELTTLSTSLGGMSRLVPPPPGISIWDTSLWETPIPQQLVTTLSYRPPIGRGKRLKATQSMRAPVPQVPQIAPAICQPPPLPWGRLATPYQQVVQLLMQSSFCCFFRLCIMHCVVLGNIVRWYASSLLGSYIHQELFLCSIGTVLNNVNDTNMFSCIES